MTAAPSPETGWLPDAPTRRGRHAATPPTTGLPEALRLRAPLPGLPEHRDFDLVPLDDVGVLFALRAADPYPVRLFVVTPEVFFPGYAPCPEAARLALGAPADRVARLVVVRPAEDGEPPTANLLAPILLDRAGGAAVQAVLDEPWPLRAPLGEPVTVPAAAAVAVPA